MQQCRDSMITRLFQAYRYYPKDGYTYLIQHISEINRSIYNRKITSHLSLGKL